MSKTPSTKKSYLGSNLLLTWLSFKNNALDNFSPVTQVSGILLDKEGKVLICRSDKNKGWGIPGGKPEKGETIEETLVREVKEEVCCEITDTKPIGVIKVENLTNPNTKPVYQVKMAAKISKVNKIQKDPATGRVFERKFVHLENIEKYINWGPVGRVMFTNAKKQSKAIKK
jgi:8-oxo-dGTP diphosphatase